MSTVTDDDERKRRSLEAGREMLEKYKAERSNKSKSSGQSQTDELTDEESFYNDKSEKQRESRANEGISSRDVTHSSVSMSEGEADGDIEGLAGRVAELEELLQGKEAIVEALNAEIDHLRAEASSPNSSQSQNSSIHTRDVIFLYQTKLQDFEAAINRRDNLIEELTSSLQQALSARDTLAAQLNSLNSMQIQSPNAVKMNLQEKIDALEAELSKEKTLTQKLTDQLEETKEYVQTLKMEKETRNVEISDYKLQINNLNEQIRFDAAEKNLNIVETLEQQKQYEARIDKIKQEMQRIVEQFTTEINTNTGRHAQQLKDLTMKHETEIMNIQRQYEKYAEALKEENKSLADRLNKELPDLESRHAKELFVFQAQLSHYKKTVEALKLELVNRSESQQTAQAEVSLCKSKLEELEIQSENTQRLHDLSYQREREMLNEQIKLHKIQLEEITSKYVTATAILESKESIERSLEQALTNATMLKEENESLKFKLDDLSSRYSAAQSLIENSQAHERTLSSRIYDLEKSLSRLSGINISTVSEFNETAYQSFDEVAIQYQLAKQKLEEKLELEKILVEKIHGLEENVATANQELEQANLVKKSYEKQLKDMKNMCDKLNSEIVSLKESNIVDHSTSQGSTNVSSNQDHKHEPAIKNSTCDLLRKIEEDQEDITNLKSLLQQREAENENYVQKLQELMEKVKTSEKECEQLKNGLAVAWAQCAEVEEKLNQTLAINDSKLDGSLSTSDLSSALHKRFKLHKTDNVSVNIAHDQSIESFSANNYMPDAVNTKPLQVEMESAIKENQKDTRHMSGTFSDHGDVTNKLNYYSALCEKLLKEKQEIVEESITLRKQLEDVHMLQESVNQLRAEKDSLSKEIQNLIEKHDEQINVIKIEAAAEVKKMQSLLLSVKEGNECFSDIKAELEIRHAKEMEELRTYFEQKCLQMEKQYSEEVFSQQSKKMSDNDSEIEELTEDLYFGAAGDCINVSSTSGHASRVGTPIIDEQLKSKNNSLENQTKFESDYDINLRMLQHELERKVLEIQSMKQNYEKDLEKQKKLYEQQISNIREKSGYVLLLKTVNQHCQTEWDAGALENGELSKLREAYNHQLEEQVALARVDIINALQEQFQALLNMESDGEDNWPSELLELRDKFTNNAKCEIQELKQMHATELLRVKEEHSRSTSRMIERHQEEINKLKGGNALSTHTVHDDMENGSHFDKNIIKERDSLSKTCAILRVLIEELIKFFVMCEEEINNTLISEVLRRQLSESLQFSELETQHKEEEASKISKPSQMEASNNVVNTSEIKIKRVHFAPQCNEIVSIINSDDDTLQHMLDKDEDITEKFREDFKYCLYRLKAESAEILNLPSTSEDHISTSSKQIGWTDKINEELSMKLHQAEHLIINYQEEMQQLKITIVELQNKLGTAENKKEIITEGYGEHDDTGGDVTLHDFSQLQEKARHVLSNGGGDCSYLLQLIEELCRQSDRLMDDAKKEKEDLQQQVPLEPTPPPYIHRVCCRKIDAADKQLRATRKFLDEQASEREVERDESAKQIHYLQEQLKERERDKERDQRITSEVEVLESQLREMTSLISDTEAKKSEMENELKAAVEKIWILREIVTDLEQQLQVKAEKEESLQLQITQLETVIAAQTKNQHELVQELDTVKMGSDSRHLNEHIAHLEEELRKHKLSQEQFNVNSAALKQMKLELRDMQNQLDKRIKELESAHMCSSNLSLSQPSEDVSIRDQIDASRCPTPDDPTALPMLPIDQLLKLKEKMLKHARAEEVVFKRIKDLKMQLTALKNQNEELQAEQDILQQTASEQLFQIEAMRGRLEQHKQSAPFAQRQATSRLELQLHEANTKFNSLERAIADKQLELNDMKAQLDRTNQLLMDKEGEIANIVQAERATIDKLKDRLKVLEEENKILQSKVGFHEHAQQELPRLIDSMLADKNEEIDHLKEQLSKKEKQLEIYSSLTMDDVQLRELMRQAEPKNSARTLSDILSIHSECEEMSEAIRAGANSTQVSPHNVSVLKVPTISAMSKEILDASAIPTIETNKPSLQVPLLDLASHSQSLSSTCPQHSHITLGLDLMHSELDSKTSSPEDNVLILLDDTKCTETNQKDNNNVQKKSHKETDIPIRNEANKSLLSQLNHDSKAVAVVKRLETSVNDMTKEIQDLQNRLRLMQDELESKSVILEKRESELTVLKKAHEELQIEFKDTVDTLTRDKHFYKNQYELAQVSENKIKKDLEEVENVLKLKEEEILEQKGKIQMNEKIITELNTEYLKLKKDMENKEEEQIRKHAILFQEKEQERQSLMDIILQKDITIETVQTRNIEIENENKQLYEYKTKHQLCKQEITEMQNEIHRLTEGLNSRDQIIRRLEEMYRCTSLSSTSSPSDEKDQEIHHLQECVKEKDKVIRQMSDDCNNLHGDLEKILNKMRESGNVVELRKKLKEERKLNVELRDMVEKLRQELDDIKESSAQRSQEDTDIEDMVQRELDLSAHLDRQIMNAIESDGEDIVIKKIEKTDDRGAVNAHAYTELKSRLSQANKANEELKKMKDDLEIQKDILKTQIAEYENRVLQLNSDLGEECKKVAKLIEELTAERNLVRTLRIQADKEQRVMQSRQIQDSELIEFLQNKLKSGMETESKLRNELSSMRQEYETLEMQLTAMKDHIESRNMDKLPKMVDLLEVERKKCISLMENYEKEERNNAELRDNLKRVQVEKDRYRKQLEVVMEEKEKLISGLALVEGVKEHLEIDLKRTKEELKAREEECEWLQKRIKTMSDAENKRQEHRNTEHNELKVLRREINNARDVMMDLEADMKQSKRELTEALEREAKLSERLESLKEREVELNKKLLVSREEDKKLKELVNELQQDLKNTSKRELELTKELRNRFSNEKNVPAKLLQKIKELSERNEKYANDKSILQEKLINAREEREQLGKRVKLLEVQMKQNRGQHDPNSKPTVNVEKLQYFYGQYLRADSRQKALKYQKRYLLCIVGGYQLSEENTISVLAQLTREQRTYTTVNNNRKSPKVRFRSAILVLIVISRMKWLVMRWRNGRRVGANALIYDSDHIFTPVRRPTLNHSPPIRERAAPTGEGALGSLALEQYYQRIRNVQQTLGIAMAESNADQIIPE
ncbi:hypothetical protein KM043_009495 [Ampulex compressa]|nr:hypothetical protein KM043_009495 [Ampulex compressa]